MRVVCLQITSNVAVGVASGFYIDDFENYNALCSGIIVDVSRDPLTATITTSASQSKDVSGTDSTNADSVVVYVDFKFKIESNSQKKPQQKYKK